MMTDQNGLSHVKSKHTQQMIMVLLSTLKGHQERIFSVPLQYAVDLVCKY